MSVGTSASGGYRTGIMETELRERLIEGLWYRDLADEIRRQLGSERQEIVGVPDIARNATLRVLGRVAVCYTPPPLVTGLDAALSAVIGDYSGEAMVSRYQEAGGAPLPSTLAHILARAQVYWLGCNEVGIHVARGRRGLIVQRARPSRLRGMQDPEDPGVPILLGWRRPRIIDGHLVSSMWDVWDISDPSDPSYYIIRDVEWSDDDGSPSTGLEVTRQAIGTDPLTGDAYPWRWTQGDRRGEPFIPLEIYHRASTGRLFDRMTGAELAQGTLSVGVCHSFWMHSYRDASWAARNVVGLSPIGARSPEHGLARTVTDDPSVVHEWERIHPDVPGQLHQWQPPSDPETLLRSLLSFEQSLGPEQQIMPIDYSGTAGDPLEQLHRAMEIYIQQIYPICRQHDAHVLEICAAVQNIAIGSTYPESGYGLLYRDEIPSPESEPGSDDTTQDTQE